ncbi:MAG: multicopper oxidase domain-containing protein, partial [Anaerolineae bacterium]
MLTRRQFLKLGAAAGAGLILPARVRASLGGAEPVKAVSLTELDDVTVDLLDPATQPKFEIEVPNALDPSFIFRPRGRRYQVGMWEKMQDLGLRDADDNSMPTKIWGYGESQADASFPGKTFVAHTGKRINVQWSNDLVDSDGNPLPHLLPVDTSLHWAYALEGYHGYTIESNGVPVVPHLHGGHTESNSDGNPEYFWSPYVNGMRVEGPRFQKTLYHYDNDQEAGTLWYHDHALGITRLNVYAGLAGFYILRDDMDTGEPDNPLGLPAFPYEIPLVIQDRMFTTDGQLFYPAFPGDPFYEGFIDEEGAILPDEDFPDGGPTALAEFFGDHILVNGKAWPRMNVERRHYRLRLLNGSDSRFYVLQLKAAAQNEDGEWIVPMGSPLPFYQVGTDDGLLASPVELTTLVLGPGERADLVVDFSQVSDGTRMIMENIGPDAPFGGDFGDDLAEEDLFPGRQESTLLIMAFDVEGNASVPDSFDPGAKLRPEQYTIAEPEDRVRKLALFEGTDEYGRLQPLLGV